MKSGCFYQNYREVRLLIVHCSATRCNRDFPLDALHRSHLSCCFASIGYHSTLPARVRSISAAPHIKSGHMSPAGTTKASAFAMKAALGKRRTRRYTYVCTKVLVAGPVMAIEGRLSAGKDTGTLSGQSEYQEGVSLL